MLKTEDLASWASFEDAVKQEMSQELFYNAPRRSIFRGHPDAEWPLTTTLERIIGRNMLVEKYFALINQIQTRIETFTNQKWDLPSYEDFRKTIEYPSRIDHQTFVYMTYLRHFGFPSPLLDWTKSPFIAAYFAFRDVSNPAKKIAIFMNSVSLDAHMMPLTEHSYIFPIGKSPRNNKRHEFQQGIYTICLKEENDGIYFSNHEDSGIDNEQSDHVVTKFTLPASERVSALHALQAYNVNSYSLFGTEESLLESLFLERYKFAFLYKMVNERRAREYGDDFNINDINNIW